MTDALFKLYTRDILRLAGGISRVGQLADADGAATRTSRLCGSVMTVEVAVEDGRIANYAQRIQACAFGQASAALFADAAPGLQRPGGRGRARPGRGFPEGRRGAERRVERVRAS